jgi:annexin A7/11
MKGFGTDEKALIRILSNKDPLQIEALRSEYERTFSRRLVRDIEKETSGWFETGLVQLARGPLLTDVHLLHWSMSGPGTKEVVLNDVLLGRSNADIHAIKSTYKREFGRSLEDAVRGDLSMKTERHFMMVLAGKRAEDSAPVDPRQVDDDVMHLYKATEGKVGTDEILVCSILTHRNDNQIRAISHAYRQKFNKDLVRVIRSEFSGHMKEALLYQLEAATDKYMHAAILLEDSMAGMGTKDHLLVARVIRYHWDRNTLSNVKGAFQQRYNRSLASRIRGETSGDYERLMLACIGE